VRKLAVGLEAEPQLLLGAAEYSAAGPDENSLDKDYLEELEDGTKVGFQASRYRSLPPAWGGRGLVGDAGTKNHPFGDLYHPSG